jgi:hypothetical protein
MKGFIMKIERKLIKGKKRECKEMGRNRKTVKGKDRK